MRWLCNKSVKYSGRHHYPMGIKETVIWPLSMKTTSLFGSMSFILMQSLGSLLMNNKSCFCMCDFEGSAHWELIFYFLNNMVIYKLIISILFLIYMCNVAPDMFNMLKKNMTLPYFSKCFIIIKRRKT